MSANKLPSIALLVLALSFGAASAHAETTKELVLTNKADRAAAPEGQAGAAHDPGGSGHRIEIANGETHLPVIVVRGTPYQMGWHLGRLMRTEMQQLVPAAVAGFKQELKVSDEALDQAWATTSGYTDGRLIQQMAGLAEGSGIPVRQLQHVQCLPLLMPYSCSSIAAWGDATEDGHLYQTRNLDWSLEAGAHNFPALVVYLPTDGLPHVTPSFAGFIGAHCGMNAAGVVLSEMGDASAREMPYNLHAPHFTAWFRTLLYDADSLTEALDTFRSLPQTKSYHFVFGDGRTDRKAVKVRVETAAGSSEGDIAVWHDNDSADEFAPHVMSCVVYNDEGRGAFPTLTAERGRLNGERLVELANQIPIKGGNVMNVVFDATGMRLWVSYAKGDQEAYKRPYAFLDLTKLDADNDGAPDWPAAKP